MKYSQELINKAFEICPISKIATYSAQYKAADLEPKHQEMVSKGLIVKTFDKDHRTDKPTEWFSLGFSEIIKEYFEDIWLWDIWSNHEKIKAQLKDLRLSNDQFQNLSRYNEITSNLDTILLLLLRKKIFNADVILYRLLLQLYHSCLEIFISGDKKEETIFKESEANKKKVFEYVKDLLKNDTQLEFKDKKSFLRKLAAFTTDNKYRFGHILNWYRNGSVHPDKKFNAQLSKIIFANLTLTLFILGENDIVNLRKIQLSLNDMPPDRIGITNLKELMNYLRK